MRRSSLVFSLAVSVLTLLAAVPAAAQPRTDQEVTPTRVVDHGYLFSLDQPGPGWRVMGAEDIRRVVPDAVAGAVHNETGMFLVVIPEVSDNVDVNAMATFLIDTLAAEQKVTERYDRITYLGQNAVRYVVTANIDGVFFRFGNTIVSHRGHLYQVLAMGLRDMTSSDGSSFEPMWNAFRFLPGEAVPGRISTHAAPDTTGVGWRTLGGTFESAAYGLRVAPAGPGWRVSIGTELETMNPDAEVGIFSESPEIYAVLIPERIVGEDHRRFAAELRQMFTMSLMAGSPQQELPVTIAGQPVDLALFRTFDAGQTLDFAHGVFFHGEHAIQVVIWWVGSQQEQVVPQLPTVVSQIELLDESTRQALAAELRSGPDPQNTVGPDFALRNGLYRDYGFDFTWRKPAGFWRIMTGQMARSVNPDARIYIEEPAQGLAGMVIAERMAGWDGQRFHDLVRSQMAPAGHPALATVPTPRAVNGVEVLSTWLDLDLGGLTLRYLVSTAVRGDRLVQLLVWGLPGNVRASETAIWEAVDGLELSADDLLGATRLPGLFRDERLGFAVRAPRSHWPITDITPPNLAALATIVSTTADDRHGVVVFAMCAVAEGQDEAWFEQLARDTVLTRFEQDMGVVNGEPVDDTLAGLPARRVTGHVPGGAGRVDLYTIQRDRTFIALVAYDEDGFGPPLQELVGSLELLD